MSNFAILYNFCLLGGMYFILKKWDRIIQSQIKNKNKFQDNFLLYDHWLMLKNEGKSLSTYFEELEYKRIGIYGVGEIANRLYEELKDSEITVVCGIDQDVCNVKTVIENIYCLQEELPEVDVIVVTPFNSFNSIENILKEKISCPIISIEEVVWSV